MYVLGCIDIPESWPIVEKTTFAVPSYLHPTIYLSEQGVCTRLSGQVGQGGETADMVSIAIRIKNDQPRKVKVISCPILRIPKENWISHEQCHAKGSLMAWFGVIYTTIISFGVTPTFREKKN